MKTKTKLKNKNKNEHENKNRNKNEFSLSFSGFFLFCFSFCLCFLKVFAFLLTPRGLQVPQTLNCLLVGLKVPQHFCSLYVDQKFPVRSTLSYPFSLTQPRSAKSFWFAQIDGQLSLDWSTSAIAHRHMAPSLTPIFRIKSCLSLFFAFDRKYPCWVNLVQKIKSVSLRLNLVASLIRLCRIQ